MCFHYYLGVSVVRDKGKVLGVDEAIDDLLRYLGDDQTTLSDLLDGQLLVR